MTYRKLNRLKRSLTLPVVQRAKELKVRLNLARPYLKDLSKNITKAAPEGEVKLCRAAKISWWKERWKTVAVADHVWRGSKCWRGVTIVVSSGFETGATLSQVDDCKILHLRLFQRGKLQVGEGHQLSASREYCEGAEGGGLRHISRHAGG